MGMYCTQFRQRVLADCESGMIIAEAARKWNITRKTIYDWKNLREKNGSLKPSSAPRGPRCKLCPYHDLIKSWILENPDIRLIDIQEKLPINVCLGTLSLTLAN